MTEAAIFVQDLAIILIAAAIGGLVCRRLGLSPVVGYLVAGMAVGPYTPDWLGVVQHVDRVRLFAELGLVFLMFGIGLSFSLKRLRQLGLSVVVVATGGALLVFTAARSLGEALGLEPAGGIFFGALLVVSSSAVIGKLLNDSGTSHDKSSQLALGVTLAEDIVAIVALTLLGSVVPEGSGAPGAGVGRTVALFGGFVLVLATLGLLVVPRVLRWLGKEASTELQTLFVAGLLFAVALMVVKAGYSLALGAFLLGAIVAETPQRPTLDRAFAGMRDMFGAIFFVAVGMSIPVAALPAVSGTIGLTLVVAVVGRALAAAVMFMLLGQDKVTAVRAGLILTPLGEFSFVIAQLGIDGGVLPREYLAVAVGAALGTALLGPVLVKQGDRIAQLVAGRSWPGFDQVLSLYHRLLEGLKQRRDRNLLWKLLRRRLVQIGVEVALVSALLVLARPGVRLALQTWGEEAVPWVGTTVALGAVLALLVLVPLIAILRNLQAVAMIVANYLARKNRAWNRIKGFLEAMLFWPVAVGLALWLWNVAPVQGGVWLAAGVVVLMGAAAMLFWRQFIRWHSEMEVALEASLGEDPAAPTGTPAWADRYAPWGLHLGELELPDRFGGAGCTLAEIDLRRRCEVAVIAIERRGFRINNPGAGATVFPGDKLLLLGTLRQIAAAKRLLLDAVGSEWADADGDLDDLTVEMLDVPAGSAVAGRRLDEVAWPQRLSVQVVGVERAGQRQLPPDAGWVLQPGDRLLIMGVTAQLNEVEAELAAGEEEAK
ncbi:cation:proton antiporter [Actomonas aquatica]|uniref:Cation:proton antiporter n=1 Tax=Actomonas aquatica TaxID=2866162 RepID=A0ABZ1CD70_9BACT|nr:cation:proton antiporter [Opitutus sp. WL0086]WRQ89433.1 cation:proton antiporter [Opitutus sp. WL0086]